jgi:MoxR-like ATPase
LVDRLVLAASEILLGKERELRLALACLFANGHLLIEDLPGVGKTTLAHLLAQILGLRFQRIQFTSDLLPADLLGISIYERETGGFRFHPGPIFSQVILADEVNRATPKAQSALLEAMEERQITVEGQTYPLPAPFFVIATQNPSYHIGTFPLPESQLDRFLMRIELGYPAPDAERALLKGEDRRLLLATLKPIGNPEALAAVQRQVSAVGVTDPLFDYIQALIAYTRAPQRFEAGLSPRAGLALLRSARAFAYISGRAFVIPEDVQTVLAPVVGHRLRPLGQERTTPDLVARTILSAIPIP